MNEQEVFKIQISMEGDTALIYNLDRSSRGQFPVDKRLLKIMNGKSKAYFLCVPHEKNKPIQIIRESTVKEYERGKK